jgi:uncharacterized protein
MRWSNQENNFMANKYQANLNLDQLVAIDIHAHPSFPWQDEALAVATHKPNVYIDLSGWSPK